MLDKPQMPHAFLISLLAIAVLRAGDPGARAGEWSLSEPLFFPGAEDGSAASDVGDGFFVGATDEKNVLRLYSTDPAVPPRALDVDVEAAVKGALEATNVKEFDLEGAARIGDVIYWIGSHGRNKSANERRERRVLFATKVTGKGKDVTFEMTGKVYTTLLDDLVRHPPLAAFHLCEAAVRAPKAEGALCIESLAAAGGRLWIGFRNPQVNNGQALLVPLLNPADALKNEGKAQLGEPLLLNLGGLGIRDMVAWKDGFLVIAGDYREGSDPEARTSRLFLWKAPAEPQDLEIDFKPLHLNPEALVVFGEGAAARVLILSDDGDPAGFRGVWLQPAKP